MMSTTVAATLESIKAGDAKIYINVIGQGVTGNLRRAFVGAIKHGTWDLNRYADPIYVVEAEWTVSVDGRNYCLEIGSESTFINPIAYIWINAAIPGGNGTEVNMAVKSFTRVTVENGVLTQNAGGPDPCPRPVLFLSLRDETISQCHINQILEMIVRKLIE